MKGPSGSLQVVTLACWRVNKARFALATETAPTEIAERWRHWRSTSSWAAS